MIYELEIEQGKEKQVISFLKQLDFVIVTPVKNARKLKGEITQEKGELPYFNAYPKWEMDVKEMRKKNTNKRTEGWL